MLNNFIAISIHENHMRYGTELIVTKMSYKTTKIICDNLLVFYKILFKNCWKKSWLEYKTSIFIKFLQRKQLSLRLTIAFV